MNKNNKSKSETKKKYKINKKRAYIALLVLLFILGFSLSIRKQAEVTLTEEVSFDDNTWQEAVRETANENSLKEIVDVPKEEKTTPKSEVQAKEVLPSEEEVVLAANIFEESGFERPSTGAVLKDYSDGELVYSETMEDWRTHNGIDFAGKVGSQVLSASDGTVKKVYKDDMLGIVVEIEHSKDVTGRYCCLQSLDFIQEGKKVKKGEIIGGVGENSALEKTMEPHFHFEIIKNGEYENPNLYFKN